MSVSTVEKRTYHGGETVRVIEAFDVEAHWRMVNGRRVLRGFRVPVGARFRVLDQVSQSGLHVVALEGVPVPGGLKINLYHVRKETT